MPPKEKPKKIDPKELELQKQAEEARRKEEEDRKRQEELKKYEVITLQTGLKMILTEYCIIETWKNPKPKDFLVDFMTRFLKKENIIDNFESVELLILAEFHLYNLIFAKEQLCLDDYRSTVLMNILWILIMNNNINYIKKNVNPVENMSPRRSSAGMVFIEKTKFDDFEKFYEILIKHTNVIRHFDKSQVIRILDFVENGYMHCYKLYKNVFDNKKKNEEILISVFVDIPIQISPLSEALYMGKKKIEIKDEEEEYVKFLIFLILNFNFFRKKKLKKKLKKMKKKKKLKKRKMKNY